MIITYYHLHDNANKERNTNVKVAITILNADAKDINAKDANAKDADATDADAKVDNDKVDNARVADFTDTNILLM